jgi:hypothetical protein
MTKSAAVREYHSIIRTGALCVYMKQAASIIAMIITSCCLCVTERARAAGASAASWPVCCVCVHAYLRHNNNGEAAAFYHYMQTFNGTPFLLYIYVAPAVGWFVPARECG